MQESVAAFLGIKPADDDAEDVSGDKPSRRRSGKYGDLSELLGKFPVKLTPGAKKKLQQANDSEPPIGNASNG